MSKRYENARATLIAQFGGLNPSLFKRALAELQRSALEDALHDVEAECMTLAASARSELEHNRSTVLRRLRYGPR
jgi:hypothetical protein